MRTLARLVLALGVVATPCRAAGPTQSPTHCARAGSGSLGELACELAAALTAAPNAVVVGIAPSASPTLKANVAVMLAVKLALALGPGASAWPVPETLANRERFRSERPLVLVQAELKGDLVVASADLLTTLPPTTRNAGTASAVLEPGALVSVKHVAARRAPDAETRRYLPSVAIAAREFKRLGPLDADVVALACGVPSDGAAPVVASVGRTFVTFGATVDGKYQPGLRREQKSLAPVAPTPLREPLASAWLTPDGSLAFGLSDRAHGMRLAPGGAASELTARLPWPGGGCAELDALLIAPRATPCAPGEPAPSEPALHDALDALAGANVVSPNGSARLVRAGRRASDAVAVVVDGAREARLEHAGAQLAVGDLDGDGAAELVTSLDTADPRSDAVVVSSWLAPGLVERLRVAVPTGVRALAICPQRADRMAPIVLATGGALWVIE